MMQGAALRTSARSPSPASAPSITELYRDFEKAHAAHRGAWAELGEADLNVPTPKLRKFERLASKSRKVADAIIATPASGLAEILLKLRVVAWAHTGTDEYSTIEDFDHMMPVAVEESEATRVLAGIQADLLRIAKAH
jgi:hypothetical protein